VSQRPLASWPKRCRIASRGLVVAGQEELYLPGSGQLSHQIQIAGSMGLEPIEKGSREVEGHREQSALRDLLQEGLVDVSDVRLEDVIEIAHRLVGVKPEGEVYRLSACLGHCGITNPRGPARAARSVRSRSSASSRIR